MSTPSIPANRDLPKIDQITEYARSLIDIIRYQTLDNTRTTICWIKLKSGFTIMGESHTAYDARFSAMLGRRYALEDAMKKLTTHVIFAAMEGFITLDQFPDLTEVD